MKMSDPDAFKHALAAAALKVKDAGGPEIELLAEGGALISDWGLHFEWVDKGPDIKYAMLMYVDLDGNLYTDLEEPITPIPGAINYDAADIDRYARWLGERITAIKGRAARGQTNDVLWSGSPLVTNP